jgi:hypothetical protein
MTGAVGTKSASDSRRVETHRRADMTRFWCESGDDAVQPRAVAGLVVERAAGLVGVEDDGSGDLAVVEVLRHGAGRLAEEGEV